MTPRRGLDMEMIVRTAARIADENGVEAVTLATLASELGVRSPSLYNHVNGLPELKEMLTTLGLTQLNERLKNAGTGLACEEELIAIADAYLAFAREHPGLYELTLKSPTGGAAIQRELGAQLVGRLLTAMEPLRLTEEDGIHAVRGFRSILHGFASIGQRGGFGMPIEVNASIRFVLRNYIRGLVGTVNESGSAD
ncbi:WHG domain-containing protein [Paenibacillus sp. LHD-117]|uniref:TetR/AcrR family transcriptional regulator n=1 Tax=Paenibacillus sp. LHD-117 TaxID=3071412 RepID=UPI0027DF0A9C|nr:WHG domain-containing protein [Paenibacillus sp. LHD-117]MDQ6419803.1 WHG domain-containing protein [Paenibacillus sp. LHD-117]